MTDNATPAETTPAANPGIAEDLAFALELADRADAISHARFRAADSRK